MFATKDYFNKARSGDYFDNLLQTNPDKLFKKYAVHPADSAQDFAVPSSDEDILERRIALKVTVSIEAGAVPADKVVAYGHLEKKSRTAALTTRMEGADCLFLEVKHAPTIGWVPIYYLPWCPGKILHLTIPPLDPHSAAPQPDIFFTAAINGCSIFIQGSRKHPTIFHAGGNPVVVGSGRDSAKIWRKLVATLMDPGNGALKAEINKRDHVTEWDLDPNKPRTTQRALDYEDYLKTNYSLPTATIKSVSPWGCVFGVRDDNDDWNFYLQENATIMVETITGTTRVEKRTIRKDKVITATVVNTQTYGRPMALRKIWPNGGGCVNFKAPLPMVLNWTKT